MRYISEKELRKWIITDGCEKGHGYIDEDDLNSMPWVENMPSAGKTETVTEFADRCRECGKQRKGHWKRHTKIEDVYDIAGIKTWGIKCQCDRCDFVTTVIEDFGYYKYCPNCGAHMIEEGEQDG